MYAKHRIMCLLVKCFAPFCVVFVVLFGSKQPIFPLSPNGEEKKSYYSNSCSIELVYVYIVTLAFFSFSIHCVYTFFLWPKLMAKISHFFL